MSTSDPGAEHEAEVPSLSDLFDDYATAYDDYEPQALADCFAYPCTIWQFGKGNVFADEEELLENIEALFGVLEREEVVHTRYEILHQAISGDTAHATLHWTHEREGGEEAMSFACHYLLIRDDDQWLVASIVNE
ncbi:DUF4440 domain-containing protein [Lutibaculum baratangense]|uniref:DUF4440 domain-containing protein n=1 Tax=Lutibaculum baratangense AMV1 TaxID=631454 RepID=V4RTK5_9HYPH|nr:nuclear transport factor 2 family protein [Lutibaculum baratangense]ESR26410.1 hypothetical protein N177_0910 [Lutibaculum baratangense AMV1]